MNPDLERRMRVLRLRLDVEAGGWAVYEATLGPREPDTRCAVRRRFALLPGWAGDTAEFFLFRAVAAELTWIYGQCCDVLHGRRAFVDLPEPVVAGWEARVQRNATIIDQVLYPTGADPFGSSAPPPVHTSGDPP